MYKHFPLPGHAGAIPAARASMAAHEQGAFWPFHDALYARGARFRPEELREIAEELGLDMPRFDASLSRRSFDAQIKRDIDLGMRLGVSGTPTAFINGRPLEGAQPELSFRAIIAEELEAARTLRADGVPAEDIYRRRTERSSSPVPARTNPTRPGSRERPRPPQGRLSCSETGFPLPGVFPPTRLFVVTRLLLRSP